MNCPECAGAVNVSCYYGEKLRCRCGKTVIAAPRPERASPGQQDLQALLAVLRANRVTSYKAGDVMIEMELAPAAMAEVKDIPAEVCDCGCSLDNHMDAGCMNATCDPAKCEAYATRQSTSSTATAPVAYTS